MDRYDESLKKWKQVDYRDFEFTLEEYPEGIDDPSITVTFENQKKATITEFGVLSLQAMKRNTKALDLLPKASGSNKN